MLSTVVLKLKIYFFYKNMSLFSCLLSKSFQTLHDNYICWGWWVHKSCRVALGLFLRSGESVKGAEKKKGRVKKQPTNSCPLLNGVNWVFYLFFCEGTFVLLLHVWHILFHRYILFSFCLFYWWITVLIVKLVWWIIQAFLYERGTDGCTMLLLVQM